jgi:hypothetical protein
MSEDVHDPRFVKAVFDRDIGISYVCLMDFDGPRPPHGGDWSKSANEAPGPV